MKYNNPLAFRPGPVTFWTTAIYLAVIIPLIYVHETVPSAPADHSLYRGLNLTEAWLDLQTIASNYHPFNSHQNDIVRDFLISRSKEILDHNGADYALAPNDVAPWSTTKVWPLDSNAEEVSAAGSKPPGVTLFDDQQSNVTWTYDSGNQLTAIVGLTRWYGQYYEGNNFYVYIHGKDDPEGDWWLSESEYKKTHRKGGVLVNCHFDSVATGYGATDDGMACVSLLQLLSYFTSEGRQPRNGIVLLFNNAEEDGLLGARAFANSPLVQFCHTFVNLEGAGAGGRAMLFRATDLEVTSTYANSPHPFGSIVATNAFQAGVVKSGTDYQIFADIYGQRGVDIAFYEPRARYHTEEDDVRHTSVNSIWHMLSAALATTDKLSQTTGTEFNGERSDHNRDLVQNGKQTDGVWFDIFGSTWVVFALRGLFAWSLTLLVATPLVLLVVTYLLVRQDKYYFFGRDVSLHSDMEDDPVKLGGWKGFFRFPLAFLVAAGLTIASVFLVAKINPLIIYSSPYSVWSMTFSLCYFLFWLIMRGASVVRPSALQRGFINIWLFVVGWAVQVFAAVAEDRMQLGALYFAAFLHSAFFVSVLISLLELFALPTKHEFARALHDAHQDRDLAEAEEEADAGGEEASGEDGDDEAEPTETTPLRSGEQGYGSDNQPSFSSTYRRSISAGTKPKIQHRPYEFEQSWSGRLPTWTWIVQFLVLAPVPVMLIGNLALVFTSSVMMTGTDGSSLLLPIMIPGVMSIILLLPLTPFFHRVTHHVPTFLLLVFLGTLIYNLVAFPFSTNHRCKFFFQQTVDLDSGTDVVALSGLEEYLREIISSLPSAQGERIECHGTPGRDTTDCVYNADHLAPNLVEGKQLEDLITVTVPDSSDGQFTTFQLDALDTRTCSLELSRPIFGFSVEGGGSRDPRFGPLPADGFKDVILWRRKWDGPWNVTLQLVEGGKSAEQEQELNEPDIPKAFTSDELRRAFGVDKLDSPLTRRAEPLEVTVRCGWSDANKPSTVPALTELKKYMPTWAVASKRSTALVEVKKTFKLPA